MIIVYITCKDKKEAEKVSKYLLKRRLIACANIFPIKSLYSWKGRLCRANEHVVLAKTRENKYNKIKEEVKTIHSYDVPCILKIKADANDDYKKWIDKEVRK